jgi:hypothetical protein
MSINYDPDTAYDTELALVIPEHLTTAVLMAALDFQEVLGDRFNADVDIEDNRILYYHPGLCRSVQLRWHDGELVAFMGEINDPDEVTPSYYAGIAALGSYCDAKRIKIEDDYPYPFDGPYKGKLTSDAEIKRRAD